MLDDYTRYQQKIIKGFYRNFEAIQVQRLSEIVTEIFLAESEKKKAAHWKKAKEIMLKLEVPATRVEHIVAQQDPQLIAGLVKELLG